MNLLSCFAIVSISILTLLFLYVKFSFSYWKSRNVPYKEPIFPFGNVKGVGRTVHIGDLMQNIYKEFKGKHRICGIYFITRPAAMILDLDLIKNILIRDFSNFDERGIYYNEKDDPISANLFTLEGKKWRNLRNKLSPTFTSGKMKFMFSTVVEVGERLRDCLQEIVKEDEELEIKDLLARFTTDVIGTCAFGIECNSLQDQNAEFRAMGRKSFENRRHNLLTSILISNFPNTARMLGVKTT